MTILLGVIMAFTALLILPVWAFSLDVIPKVVVLLAGAAIAIVGSRRIAMSRTIRWFTMLIGLQAAAIVLTTVFSTHPELSILGSAWRKSGLAVELAVLAIGVLVAWQLAGDAAAQRRILRITVLAGLPVAMLGFVQYFGFDPLLPPNVYHFGEGQFTIVRPPSTMGHAAYFATYLLYVIFGGVALVIVESSRVWKATAAATVGIASVALVLSGTRAALVGLAAGAMLLAFQERPARKWLVLGAAGLAILLGGFYVSPAGERLRARVHWSTEDRLGGSRLLLWRDTLRMSEQHWLKGYGPETFALEFPAHQSVELGRAYPEFYHESAHNIFLDALVSRGVVGLLPLIGLVALGLAMARGPLGAAFVAILVSQQFTAFTAPTELYFFLTLAMLVASGSEAASVTAASWPVLRWAAAVPLAGFAIYLGSGDALLASASRALDRGDSDRAARFLDSAAGWRATADVYFSRRFVQQRFEEPGERFRAAQYAMKLARRAPETSEDRQNALVNLAAFCAVQNDARGVEQALWLAIAASPNWFKPHWLLAQVLAREGRTAEAEAEARVALDRDGGKDPEVAQTMKDLRR